MTTQRKLQITTINAKCQQPLNISTSESEDLFLLVPILNTAEGQQSAIGQKVK